MVATSLIALTALLIGAKALAQGPTLVKIDGSSTVFPITEAVAEEFQTSTKGKVKITVGISGTGGGFKKFCRGETDVQNASRPIQTSELADCKKAGITFVELPIAYDAIAVVVNPKATWATEITVEDLKKMWEPGAQGKITKWNQINPKWPDAPLKLYGAGTDSGTFDYFTEAIVGKAKSSRGDYTASEDDNTIVQGVSQDTNALGYFGLAYYETNKKRIRALAVIGGDKSPLKGKGVYPSNETVENGTYYPLARPVFIYVSQKSLQRPEVKQFAEFYLKNARKLVPEVKYVALPAKVYDIGLEHLNKSKLGTVFGGHSDVGMKVEDLMKREGTM
ncbi:MAG: PstS family phosphate ABC transporter substrate-binding protein [Bdellovibrio sp.]